MAQAKVNVWRLGDVLAPSIPVGYFFGRFGCLDERLLLRPPDRSAMGHPFPGACPDLAARPPILSKRRSPHANLRLTLERRSVGRPRWLYRRKKFDGQVFAVYLMAYAVTRSTVEFFRGDYPNVGLMTPAQLLSIPIMVAGIASISHRPVAKLQTPRGTEPNHPFTNIRSSKLPNQPN